MSLKTKVCLLVFDSAYFTIFYEKQTYHTSKSIADLFEIPVETYNQILINKVIQHEDFKISNDDGVFDTEDFVQNVSFSLNEIEELKYVERFKEVFYKELTMLSLNGI